MHRVVFEEPYEFIPPHHGRLWSHVMFRLFPRALRKGYGVVGVEVEGAEKLRESLDAGHGVLLAANHCRLCDPFVLGRLFVEAKTLVYGMVGWHVFKRSAWDCFRIRRLGCFSIFREGVDRASMVMAITVLKEAKRPLVLFPEGTVSRCNDRVEGLMKGTGFIARQAAVMRAKEGEGKVVIHPVGIRYVFVGGEEAGRVAIEGACDDLEKMMGLEKDGELDWRGRVGRLMHGLLGVMEAKHLGKEGGEEVGSVVDDAWYDRKDALIEAMLGGAEGEFLEGKVEGDVVGRVKVLRSAILPAMVAKKVDGAERKRRWGFLADGYYAQEMSHFHRGYLEGDVPVERWIEMVERVEEILIDESRVMGKWRAVVRVGDAIEVEGKRGKKKEGKDEVMVELKAGMERVLDPEPRS